MWDARKGTTVWVIIPMTQLLFVTNAMLDITVQVATIGMVTIGVAAEDTPVLAAGTVLRGGL